MAIGRGCDGWLVVVFFEFFFSPFCFFSRWLAVTFTVNHSKNFVDPDSGAHTNTMEGLWALVKRKLKSMCGTLYEHVPRYLDEFTWFRNFAGDRAFEQLLEDIAEQFPLQ